MLNSNRLKLRTILNKEFGYALASEQTTLSTYFELIAFVNNVPSSLFNTLNDF